MTSGVEKLRGLRARMDADLERFRERLADAQEASEEAARATAAPVVPTRLEGADVGAENYRPNTWLV